MLYNADLNTREQPFMKTVLVINLEVKDNHEEAAIGGRLTFDLCQEVCLLLFFIVSLVYHLKHHRTFTGLCIDRSS